MLTYIAIMVTSHGVLECVLWGPNYIHQTAIRASHPNLCTTPPPQAHFLDICCQKYLNRVLTYIAIVLTTHGALEWVHWDPYPIH